MKKIIIINKLVFFLNILILYFFNLESKSTLKALAPPRILRIINVRSVRLSFWLKIFVPYILKNIYAYSFPLVRLRSSFDVLSLRKKGRSVSGRN